MARRSSVVLLLAVACRPAATAVAPDPAPTHAPATASEPVAAPPSVAVEPMPPRFALHDRAPVGLDAAGIREYARNQGDPLGGDFDATGAFVGDDALASGTGKLFAILRTDQGTIECELLERSAPRTVANFVGLARGVRPFRDHTTKAWITGRFYDGTIFHRVIADFMIQGGDRSGTGTGETGYVLPDEIDATLVFDAPGVLAMANSGSNTGNSQFFITVAALPHLNGSQVIFGRCDPKVAIAISKLPVDRAGSDRPATSVVVQRIDFERR